MKSKKKTNAARILDRLKIPYEFREYKVDEEDLSAVHVANTMGVPIEQLYKTIVCRANKTGIIMAVIAGDATLDLKALAAASGNKNAETVHLKELFDLTGYVRGGCSPLGAKKNYPVFVDKKAALQEYIAVSAGIRGGQLWLKPDDLIAATKGTYAKITR